MPKTKTPVTLLVVGAGSLAALRAMPLTIRMQRV